MKKTLLINSVITILIFLFICNLSNSANNKSPPQFIFPVYSNNITSKFGFRFNPFSKRWQQHNGIDIAIPEKTKVKAVASGIVTYAKYTSGYGFTIKLKHSNGYTSTYAHLYSCSFVIVLQKKIRV